MALKRNPVANRLTLNNTFVSCSLVYLGEYSGQQKRFQIAVLAADLPGNTNPTEQQIQDAADAKATVAYNQWKEQIDAQNATVTKVQVQGGVVSQ